MNHRLRSAHVSSHRRVCSRLILIGLGISLLTACVGGFTSMARPVAGQVQMVTSGGQSYALRVIPDLGRGGYATRLVAPTDAIAKSVLSDVCDGRAYQPQDWPEGRLLRDSATGEWAISGDCPFLLAQR